jgi:hypothetical protein
MRKLLLIAGVAALTVPGMAMAQPDCRQQQHNNRVAGTVVGAGVGALAGSALAGPHSRGAGAVLGAVGGGALGNIAGGAASANCAPAQAGYYDDNGVWHASTGYYDANGDWVEGPPPAPPAAPYAGSYGGDVNYQGAMNLRDRENWLEQQIDSGQSRGEISSYDAERDRMRLSSIRDFERRLRVDHDGLTADDRAQLDQRLDNLRGSLDAQRQGGGQSYNQGY